jgi:hypothetical protein
MTTRRSARLAAKSPALGALVESTPVAETSLDGIVVAPRGRTNINTASLEKSVFATIKNELNVAVLRGLRGQTQRVFYTAKVQISFAAFSQLKKHFGLAFKTRQCPEFLDEFRIVRAFFQNRTDLSKIIDGSFRVALRNSRVLKYKVFKKGELVERSIQPLPYIYFSFMRMDKVMNLA